MAVAGTRHRFAATASPALLPYDTVLYARNRRPVVYLAFVDDSGSTRPYRAGTRGSGRVHILSSLIVHERDLCGARAAINDAKRDLFAVSDPESLELHTYDIWNSSGDFSGDARSLNLERKNEVLSRAVGGIAESGGTLVSVVVWKDRLPDGLTSSRIRTISWRLLVERFEAYLATQGGGDLGMIFSDASNRTTEAEIMDALRETDARIGLHKRHRSLVLEDMIFKDSRREPLLQAADVVAYILHKRCRDDPSFAGWFETLKQSMWSEGGSIYGFGIKNYPDPRMIAGRR